MCAIAGAIDKEAKPSLITDLVLRLSRLQHRGEESAGVVYSNGKYVWTHKKYGLVSQVFTPDVMEKIKERRPTMIIGQTHYSTSGSRSERNIPPQWLEALRGRFGLIHNGNIPNLEDKRYKLEIESGGEIKFDEDERELLNDSEFMLKKIYWHLVQNHGNTVEAIRTFMLTVNGSYSAALLCNNGVYMFRDPGANRPFFHSRTSDGQLIFASETCAFAGTDGEIKSVEPGSIIEVSPSGEFKGQVIVNKGNESLSHCVFENIYFSMPDSRTFTARTESYFRSLLGRELALNFPVANADLVTCVPESGRAAAEGFAEESKVPFRSLFVRDYYIGRTFIHPTQEERERLASFKYRLINESAVIKDKVIVLVDDSIIRLTTMKRLVPILINAGAKEVHVRVSAPPTISPCYYGIDMPSKKNLIAANMSIDQIKQELKATSLAYNTMDSLNLVIGKCGRNHMNFCKACFTGEYPIPLD